mmetsp:Transcript_167/g.467  ORF Transcript_167/g.467 Transcript_167/m.467 type:complete len:313 (-) Transcript_167:797-1735(-)
MRQQILPIRRILLRAILPAHATTHQPRRHEHRQQPSLHRAQRASRLEPREHRRGRGHGVAGEGRRRGEGGGGDGGLVDAPGGDEVGEGEDGGGGGGGEEDGAVGGVVVEHGAGEGGREGEDGALEVGEDGLRHRAAGGVFDEGEQLAEGERVGDVAKVPARRPGMREGRQRVRHPPHEPAHRAQKRRRVLPRALRFLRGNLAVHPRHNTHRVPPAALPGRRPLPGRQPDERPVRAGRGRDRGRGGYSVGVQVAHGGGLRGEERGVLGRDAVVDFEDVGMEGGGGVGAEVEVVVGAEWGEGGGVQAVVGEGVG